MKENNINRWAREINSIDPEFSNQLNEDKNIGFENLKKLVEIGILKEANPKH